MDRGRDLNLVCVVHCRATYSAYRTDSMRYCRQYHFRKTCNQHVRVYHTVLLPIASDTHTGYMGLCFFAGSECTGWPRIWTWDVWDIDSASEDDTHLATAARWSLLFLNTINICQWGSSKILSSKLLTWCSDIKTMKR